jgi:hypothetical protein
MPRFSLQTLFCLILCTGLALGWWLDRSRLARELEASRAHWIESVVAENLKRHEAEDALKAAIEKLQSRIAPTESTP